MTKHSLPAERPLVDSDLRLEQVNRIYQAQRQGELETEIQPAVAWGMILLFGIVLASIPVGQATYEWWTDHSMSVGWMTSGSIPSRQELSQSEDTLENQSIAIKTIQPEVQLLLTSWGRFGHKHVVLGRQDWLYYRPGIDTLTGRGFLDGIAEHPPQDGTIAQASGTAIVHDPRPAILQFKQWVKSFGAELVILLIPDKASIEGGRLSTRLATTTIPIRNSSTLLLFEQLRNAGVTVIDPAPESLLMSEQDHYLRHDTHWTPGWMSQVAERLAEAIRPRLGEYEELPLTHKVQSVSAPGDLVDMLNLPGRQQLFIPQIVEIQRVHTMDGDPLKPNPDSPVLLIGDSFTNIFSAGPMGWGEHAGLAEQLSYHLGMPIDWLARNDAGAHATRELLFTQQSRRQERLRGKKVVIWQFAERELALGNWRLLRWQPTPEFSETPISNSPKLFLSR